MLHTILAGFSSAELPAIAQRLNDDYYCPIEDSCGSIESAVTNIRESGDEHASTSLYISLSVKLLEKIRHHMRMRKLVTIPYIYQLYEKVTANHNCSECEDGCQIAHSLKATGVTETHQHIKEMLYRLQLVATPLYAVQVLTDPYKELRNEIVLVDTKLTELFYLEEAVLLPKIKEAQRKIHVRN